MPYQIISEPSFVRIVCFDDLTRRDLRSLADALAAIENALPVAPDRLTDLSQVSVANLTYGDMLDYVERRKKQRLANRVKCAIVAPESVQVGFARMFQLLSDHPQTEVEVFAILAEAEVWLMGP